MGYSAHSTDGSDQRRSNISFAQDPSAARADSGSAKPLSEELVADIGDRLARSLNIDRTSAVIGVDALLPMLVRSIKGAVEADPRGLSGFLRMLQTVCEHDLLARSTASVDEVVRKGRMLLTEILGPTEVHSAILADAGYTTGLDRILLDRMLGAIAVLLAQDISQQADPNLPQRRCAVAGDVIAELIVRDAP